ncbi:MarR family winged helix-turn-helix transcriptional regulator [Pseudogracilibacillus auburnensis]|uniref:MarR family transcriptional regulator n=1 Tax=Pseudogracilibacillus auburnensis TaxID=1494959 RepID=A0A2V3VIX2_9BACI|nr:MarR family transcriptional regulator [Pseudogracilibacillus auburnensis]MBO1003306.1 MarR family transcriptional regulator [Pseudogracilibacillus auburnensis]PXW80841.1 MarR family transcriptional regulator [Pseudogracilibacillus auburnensis]
MKKEQIRQINRLQNNFNILIANKFEDKLDNQLTAKQVLMLELIKQGINSTKDLATKLNVSTSAISQILNKLDDKGYIERTVNPQNRREIILKLADKADQYFHDLTALKDQINQEVYGKLSLEDLKHLKKILEKLQTIAMNETNDDRK